MLDFSEKEFLQAVISSISHSEATKKLGYSRLGHNPKYYRLLNKLQPNISHFCNKSLGKLNIPNSSKINQREYRRKYYKKKRKENIQFKLSQNLRGRLRKALHGNYKTGSAVSDLGCSIDKFKLWLEMHWQDGMSWENYGDWNIDHIKPLDSFNLSDRNELLKAVHFTNLQPLWAKDNFRKSNKM